MSFIKWNDRFHTDIEQIDEQHFYLISMVNDLSDELKKGSSHSQLEPIFISFVEYTKIHFAYEEKILKRRRYPLILGHQLEHERFITKIEELLSEFRKDQIVLSIKMIKFLGDWLVEHILVSDRKYANHLQVVYNQKDLVVA